MTQRKPAGVSFETWIERQITDAQRRGEFDRLAGAGKPLSGLDDNNEFAWVARMMKRENLNPSVILPPSLALAKEVEDLPVALAACRSEKQVRDAVAELNERIRMAHLRPQEGPPLLVMPIPVDDAVRGWSAARDAALAERAAAREAQEAERQAAERAAAARRRGWRRWTRSVSGRPARGVTGDHSNAAGL